MGHIHNVLIKTNILNVGFPVQEHDEYKQGLIKRRGHVTPHIEDKV